MTARRGKGTGGLVQRHDHPTCPPLIDGERAAHKCQGRWAGTIEIKQDDGTARRKYVYAKSRKAAQAKLDEALAAKRSGTLVIGKMTVEEWMTRWLKKRREPPKPLKPNTWNSYESKIRLYIVPALGKKRLSAVTPSDVDNLYASMRVRGLQEATVRQTHAILQRALKDAVRKGALGRSPMDRVDAPGTDTNDREQFTFEQAGLALKLAGDSLRWWLALFYGMRQGEVLGMDWRYVHWQKQSFEIVETRQNDYGYGGAILGSPKAKASLRELPMLPQIEIRMRLVWESQGRPTEGLVFPNRNGGLRDPRRDWQQWRDFLTANDLPIIALHAARNTAASQMEAVGIPDRVVGQILGQAQVKTTHKYQTAELERVRGYLEAAARALEASQHPADGRARNVPALGG